MDPAQLRELIDNTLCRYALQTGIKAIYSPAAVELLMLTAAQETHCGQYIKQKGGPALGIFQIEPATYDDVWDRYLTNPSNGGLRVHAYMYYARAASFEQNLSGNLPLQIIVARLRYWMVSDPMPADTPQALAEYYKQHYNTPAGAATVAEAVSNYKRYAQKGE